MVVLTLAPLPPVSVVRGKRHCSQGNRVAARGRGSRSRALHAGVGASLRASRHSVNGRIACGASSPSLPSSEPGSSGGKAERAKILEQIRALWDLHSIPEWHRNLYKGHCFTPDFPIETLLREVAALERGTAVVQVALRAVEAREETLDSLVRLRLLHDDLDFLTSQEAKALLMEELVKLRMRSVAVVEALVTWKHSSKPLLGSRGEYHFGGDAGALFTMAVDRLCFRQGAGPCWPHGPRGDDYLVTLANDVVVRTFETVLELPTSVDPFLAPLDPSSLSLGGAKGQPVHLRLPLPSLRGKQYARVEAARLILEDDLACTKPAWDKRCGFASEDCKNLVGTQHTAWSAAAMRLQLRRPSLPPALPPRPASASAVCGRSSPSGVRSQRPLRVASAKGRPLSPESSESLKPKCEEGLDGLDSQPSSNVSPPTSPKQRLLSPKAVNWIHEKRRPSTVTHEGPPVEKSLSGNNLSPRSPAPKRGSTFGPSLSGASSEGGRRNRLRYGSARQSHGAHDDADAGRMSHSLSDKWAAASMSSCGEGDSAEVECTRSSTKEAAGVLKLPLGATFDKLVMIFNKFKDNDENVHYDDTVRLLELSGNNHPSQDLLDAAFQSVTQYTTIGLSEFISFVAEFEVRQRKVWADTFAMYDLDGSGTIESCELVGLMKSLGIEPMRHVIAEVIAEVDHGGDGELNLDEFYEVMALVNQREGFSKSEHSLMLEVFEKFDRDGSGEMDVDELVGVLQYLGYTNGMKVAAQVVKEVDIDHSGTVNTPEFLLCMRKIRDLEVEDLKSIMRANDEDGSGTIGASELKKLLSSAGYFPEDSVIDEIAVVVDVLPSGEYDLSALWQFLGIYREREGLSAADMLDIKEAFDHYGSYPDRRCSSARDEHTRLLRCVVGGDEREIETAKVGQALRFMGYSLSFAQQQLLMSLVDLHQLGSLSWVEFRKLIRMCRDREIQSAYQAFMDLCHEGPYGELVLLYEDADVALRVIGCVTATGDPPDIEAVLEKLGTTKHDQLLSGQYVDMETFIRVVRYQGAINRRAFRYNYGFSREELLHFRRQFSVFDVDGDGNISRSELVTLIEVYFPKMAHNPRLRPTLTAIMQSVEVDGNRPLGYEGFIMLMRLCRDEQAKSFLEKERRAVLASVFTLQEVQEFRELFLSNSDADSGIMEFADLRELIGSVCPLGEKGLTDLRSMVCEITSMDDQGIVDRESLDFPEFLQVIRKILDSNFRRVKDITRDAASRKRRLLEQRSLCQ